MKMTQSWQVVDALARLVLRTAGAFHAILSCMIFNLPRLIPLRGNLGQTAIPLNKSPLRLGRDPAQNDIALPDDDKRISRQHLELVAEYGRWVLIDHSRNGVLVNGAIVKQEHCELQHGDHLAIGDSVEFRFDDPNSTFAADPSFTLAELPPPTGLYLDPDRMLVWRDGSLLEAKWSPQELALLLCLYDHRGQICRYAEIVAAVWGADSAYGREHVHELIARLRHKLEPDPAHSRYLVSQPGHGYILLTHPAQGIS
jgi:hypothetical protein